MTEPNLEEIINKRLLLKYQRGLTKFSSDYINFLNSPTTTPQDKQKATQQLLQDLSTLQYQVFKYQTALYSLQQDSLSIQSSLQSTNESIEVCKKQIVDLKESLVEQKKIMTNKLEYNIIAQQTKIYGKKSETLKEIESVRSDIEARNKMNQKELELIAEQESYLLTMISSLSCLLETSKVQ